MVSLMNLGHLPVARWGLRFLSLMPEAKVLDCGCGGGANLKRWLKKCPKGVVAGIDYSFVNVKKAEKVNEAAVHHGDVADMGFANDCFEAVTAFETVYFWPDLPQSFRVVRRVFKPGGTFLICNECSGDATHDVMWTKLIGGATIYRDTELEACLQHPCRANTQEERLTVRHGTEMKSAGSLRIRAKGMSHIP